MANGAIPCPRCYRAVRGWLRCVEVLGHDLLGDLAQRIRRYGGTQPFDGGNDTWQHILGTIADFPSGRTDGLEGLKDLAVMLKNLNEDQIPKVLIALFHENQVFSPPVAEHCHDFLALLRRSVTGLGVSPDNPTGTGRGLQKLVRTLDDVSKVKGTWYHLKYIEDRTPGWSAVEELELPNWMGSNTRGLDTKLRPGHTPQYFEMKSGASAFAEDQVIDEFRRGELLTDTDAWRRFKVVVHATPDQLDEIAHELFRKFHAFEGAPPFDRIMAHWRAQFPASDYTEMVAQPYRNLTSAQKALATQFKGQFFEDWTPPRPFVR